jgi:hypothetical protein
MTVIYNRLGKVAITLHDLNDERTIRAFLKDTLVLDVDWEVYRGLVVYTIHHDALPVVELGNQIPDYQAGLERNEEGKVVLRVFHDVDTLEMYPVSTIPNLTVERDYHTDSAIAMGHIAECVSKEGEEDDKR